MPESLDPAIFLISWSIFGNYYQSTIGSFTIRATMALSTGLDRAGSCRWLFGNTRICADRR